MEICNTEIYYTILNLIQNGIIRYNEIAKQFNMSESALFERIQKMSKLDPRIEKNILSSLK